MQYLKKIFISIISIIIVFVIFSQISFAAESSTDPNPNTIKSRLGAVRTEAGYQEAGSNTMINMIAGIVKMILSFLGIMFLVLTLISGFQWMMSNGNEEIISKAKERMKNSVIGLAIVILSYSISYFIFSIIPSV